MPAFRPHSNASHKRNAQKTSYITPETMCFPNTVCAKQGPMPLSYRCHDARKTKEFRMLTRRPIHPHVLLLNLLTARNSEASPQPTSASLHLQPRTSKVEQSSSSCSCRWQLPRSSQTARIRGLSIVPSGTLMMFLSSFYIPKVPGSSPALRNTTTQQGHSVSNMKKVKRSSAFNYPCQKLHEHAQGPF